MKRITAVIKPHKLDPVHKALVELGVNALTSIEIKAFDKQMGHAEIHRGKSYNVAFMPMLQVETVVPDELATQVVDSIRQSSGTGSSDDGQIYIGHVEETVRIAPD